VKRQVRHYYRCELQSRFCIKTSKGVKEVYVYNTTHPLAAGAALAGLLDVAPGAMVAGAVVTGGGAGVEPVPAGRLDDDGTWPMQEVTAIQQVGIRQRRGKGCDQTTDWKFG
jgi:hypothetical protein